MKKIVKINESTLQNIVIESVKRVLKEADSYGWIVDDSEADEAYEFFCNEVGEDEANRAIVRAMGSTPKAEILAYLFRMYDLKNWKSRTEKPEIN